MPGFSEFVKNYRSIALRCHHVRKCQGKPSHGHVANIRRITRAQYHYRVKCVKIQQNSVRSERMAECVNN